MKSNTIFIISILFCFVFCKTSKQNQNLTVERLIKCISTSSFYITTNYVQELVISDTCVKELLLMKEKPLYLLKNSLNDSSKTIIIHLILTKLIQPDSFVLKIEPVYKQGTEFDIDYVNYSLNNLRWKWYPNNSYHVDRKSIIEIEKYWGAN